MTNLQTLKAQIAVLERAIEDKQGEICTAQSNIESFEYECSESDFDEYLDEIESEVTVCGMTYNPSDVLKSCDPVAYRCAKSDYESNYDLDNCEEYQELWTELQGLEIDLEGLESELEELQDELDNLESEED